jgi:uncharacterized membrane protein
MQRLLITITLAAAAFGIASAQGGEMESTMLAKVTRIVSEEMQAVPNTGTTAVYQTVEVVFMSGNKKGESAVISDNTFRMEAGDKLYVRHVHASDGTDYYSIQDAYRLDALLWLAIFFVCAILLFGGKQGLLSLAALFVSFGVIFKLLFPYMLSGGNVIMIATSGALLSLAVAMYLTHGFTRLTTSAFLGCSLSVAGTLLLAKYAVSLAGLTGFASDESVYLNIATEGRLDFVALLIGGIIIGVIGVIDDISITQASVVSELRHADPNLTRASLYAKAIKVGKDHMGAVINTLILAYAGASLPLVLLLYTTNAPTFELINREVIATEIIRSIVGSIGLIMAVPLTTFIAVMLMKKKETGNHHHYHSH